MMSSRQSGRRQLVRMQKKTGGHSFRILLVDACSIYRRGLRSLIETAIAHAEVIEANSLSQALSLFEMERYDLILVDFEISRFQAIEPLKKACHASPAARLAVISATDTRADILASLTAGYHGFISKNQSDDQVLDAISDLLSGAFMCRIRSPRIILATASLALSMMARP